jgi:hypothetical protein
MNDAATERELIVAYILRYAARHNDIRRAALEVVAERIQAGDHEMDRYLLVHPDDEKMTLNLPNRFKR